MSNCRGSNERPPCLGLDDSLGRGVELRADSYPEEVSERRAHKWTRVRPPSDDWRKRLLNRCSKQIQQSTDVHTARRKKYLMLREAGRQMQLPVGSLSFADYYFLLADLEDLLKERREEEAQLVEAFENMCKGDRDDVEELLESQHGVICPVCGGCLLVRQGRAFCKCGLSVGGELCEEFVKHRLAEIWERHVRCDGVRYEMRKELGEFLWVACSGCHTEEIVF